MKIAAVQFNPIVGDFAGNLARHIELYDEAMGQGADLVVFPEMSLAGYPLEDLVQRSGVLKAAWDSAFAFMAHVNGKNWPTAGASKRPAVIFGLPAEGEHAGEINNEAWFYDPTDVAGMRRVKKFELPNYGVFDEKRVFVAGGAPRPIDFRGTRIGLMICEDAWFPRVTAELIGESNANGCSFLLSVNGSPFEAGKNAVRRQIVADRIEQSGLPFMYVNMVGGQDELVFDGGSFFYDGQTVQEVLPFQEGIFYFEYKPPVSHPVSLHNYPIVDPTGVPEIYHAIVIGTRDYLKKQGFKSVVLGYSGGVDSGLVAAIACDVLGAKNVHIVRLPSKFSSKGSLDDAANGADLLGAMMRTIPIEGVVDALRAAYAGAGYDWIVEEIDRPFLKGLADENIQARARGNILMAISNQEGHILLTTGNKSEVSCGFSTIYGDMSGGFNPIKDCYKTLVWDLCRYRNGMTAPNLLDHEYKGRPGIVVPEEIISKPPSAELAPDQKDENTLGRYEDLDRILALLIEGNKSDDDVITETGFTPDYVTRISRLVFNAEYKRRQAAPGVKITSRIHGRDRRYPIVNAWRG